MAEKTSKERADRGVMANLPSTRPDRLSRRARAGDEPAANPAPKRAPARKPAAERAPSGKPAADRARARKPAAEPARPKAVRAGAPKLGEPARRAGAGRDTAAETPGRRQSGPELAVTVVKAAGELAQVGATVAGQLIKRAAGRLPRP